MNLEEARKLAQQTLYGDVPIDDPRATEYRMESHAQHVLELADEVERKQQTIREMEEALHQILHDCTVLADHQDIAQHAADALNEHTGWTIEVGRETLGDDSTQLESGR